MAGKKIRVYQLAKRVGKPNDEVIAFLKKEGIEVKSHASTVDEETAALIEELMQDGTATDAADKPAADDAPATAAPAADDEPKVHLPEDVEAKTEEEYDAEDPLLVKEGDFQPKYEPKYAKLDPQQERLRGPKQKKHKHDDKTDEDEDDDDRRIELKPPIVVKTLAEAMDIKPNVLIMELMQQNIMANITQSIDTEVAQTIAANHGFELVAGKRGKGAGSAPAKEAEPEPEEVVFDDAEVEPRPPIVTFLGHVDHGKTSLQDKMRNTSVVEGEAGRITQHVGASQIEHNGQKITFIDTPGHAAFTAMRARGANVTDIVILVVAADDGFMPQTIEAMNHAKAAGVQIIVAVNKMDLATADPEKVLRQMMENEMMPEDWGGEFGAVRVSAETGDGLDDLLERILLESEMLELRANPKLPGRAVVIESNIEQGLGTTASVIVQNGTIKAGDAVICGQYYGRVKALIDSHGKRLKQAGPSTPVKIVGLDGVPNCGDTVAVCGDEKTAKRLAAERGVKQREEDLAPQTAASLEDLFEKMAAEKRLDLKVIVKTDVAGTCEAVCDALHKLDSPKIHLDIVLSGVGAITENDILLASASQAMVVGFHVRVNPGVNAIAKREGIEIRLYSVIYELVEQIKEAMVGKLEPEHRERPVGKAKIQKIFTLSNGGKICGCAVTEGAVRVTAKARVLRQNELIYNGDIVSLRHFQDDVKEVRAGQECGIRLDNFLDFEEGDIVDVYEYEEVKPSL